MKTNRSQHRRRTRLRRTTRARHRRNGSIHEYTRDVLGRSTLDAVTTLGTGVDGSVRALGYTYNTQGLPDKITSYSDAAATTVVNQLQRTYNGLGQMTGEYQAHSGAVNTSTTPKVQYAFSTLDDGARLVAMTYPNGRVLHYVYATGLDDTIGRLSYLADDNGSGGIGTHLEEYAYLGLSILNRLHPESGVDLNVTLDDLGRVVTQDWNDGTNSPDKYTYTYDRNSNRLTKANDLNSALDEAYTYDNLNRLSATTRNGSAYQSWDLDATGNWDSFTNQGTTDDRTHNLQNQVTEAEGNPLGFDANGNMTGDENGTQLVYDSWNRLVKVKDSTAATLQTYTYDAVNRRITEGSTDLYLSSQDQVLEERNGTTVKSQNVWSPVFVDAMVERDRDTDANGTLDERIYALQDANENITALVGTNGAVLQRYVQDSYGNQTVLTLAWTVTTDAYGFLYGHQGGRFDPATGLYHFRARDYDPKLGRWMQEDMAYIDGTNLYNYLGDSPHNFVDPTGRALFLPGPGFGGPWSPPIGDPYWNRKPLDGGRTPLEEYMDNESAGWLGAILNFEMWMGGRGGTTFYGPHSNFSKEMSQSSVAGKLRESLKNKNKNVPCDKWVGVTNVRASFGASELVADFNNGTAQFVGSASGDAAITGVGNGKVTVTFTLKNTTSLTSFLYKAWPNAWNVTTPNTPFTNWTQVYEWEETYPCSCE